MEVYTENRKARFNYELLDTYEAGIELFGYEVKAVRAGKAVLEGAHISVRGGEAFLIGASIAPYQVNNTPKGYEPSRHRKLLLTAKELRTLEGTERGKGLTLVPVSLYNKSHKIKLSFAVARGKKKFDKRETIKRREAERDVARTLSE